MAALPRRDRPCGRLEPWYFRARTALGEVCDVDNWVRHTAAKDRTFKTVRPNQGTATGDQRLPEAPEMRSPKADPSSAT